MKWGIPQGSILGPVLFIIHIYIYIIPENKFCIRTIFADDTSVIISSRNFEDFSSVSNLVLSHLIKWFAANNLVLNFDKTNIMKFVTKKSSHSTLHIGYTGNYIAGTMNTKFLGLQINNHINWKNHVEQMILKKQSTLCC